MKTSTKIRMDEVKLALNIMPLGTIVQCEVRGEVRKAIKTAAGWRSIHRSGRLGSPCDVDWMTYISFDWVKCGVGDITELEAVSEREWKKSEEFVAAAEAKWMKRFVGGVEANCSWRYSRFPGYQRSPD